MDDAPPDSEDDSSISDDEILYRRIAHYGSGDLVAVDAITGHRRPSSGAFKSDNDGISVYLDGVLSEVALGPQDLVVRRRTQVVAFRAAVPRQLSLGVVRDAWPTGTDDDNHPRNAAHAPIVGSWPQWKGTTPHAESTCSVLHLGHRSRSTQQRSMIAGCRMPHRPTEHTKPPASANRSTVSPERHTWQVPLWSGRPYGTTTGRDQFPSSSSSRACARSAGYGLVNSTHRPSSGCAKARLRACSHCRVKPSRLARVGSAP